MAVYPSALLAIAAGTLDWENDTIRAMLVDASATYNRTHDTVSDVVGDELSNGTRVTLTTIAPTDNGTDRIVFDANDAIFVSQTASQTVGACIVYKFDTDDATSTVIAFVDGTDISTDGSNVTVSFNASGVFGMDYA
jgi:hypothetical protein